MSVCSTCLHDKKCCKGFGSTPCCYCNRNIKCTDQNPKTNNYTPLMMSCPTCKHKDYCKGDKKYCRNWVGN